MKDVFEVLKKIAGGVPREKREVSILDIYLTVSGKGPIAVRPGRAKDEECKCYDIDGEKYYKVPGYIGFSTDPSLCKKGIKDADEEEVHILRQELNIAKECYEEAMKRIGKAERQTAMECCEEEAKVLLEWIRCIARKRLEMKELEE